MDTSASPGINLLSKAGGALDFSAQVRGPKGNLESGNSFCGALILVNPDEEARAEAGGKD